MAIGAAWAEIWASVWGPVWSQSAPEPQPEPEPTVQTPAGKARKRRLYVEIDGQRFDVESAEHARALFDRAKALASQAAEKAVQAQAKKTTKVVPIKVSPPVITASPSLDIDLTEIRQALTRIYEEAAMVLEMRMLLTKQAEQDEEESILLLM